MRYPIRHLLLSLACSAALAAQAQTPPGPFDVPAGDLATALNALARQSDLQLVYRAEQALQQLLAGSGLRANRDDSGAVLILAAAPASDSRSGEAAVRLDTPAPPPAPVQEEPEPLEPIQVTGSRIPRAQVEGPAPISVVTAQEIKASGFTTIPDLLRSLTVNGGATQRQQSAGGAAYSPGAPQVALRGLGPTAEQEADRLDQHRLAGAGLAGERGEPGAEHEPGAVDDAEVAYRQLRQHRAGPVTGHPVRTSPSASPGSSGRRRSTAGPGDPRRW